MIRRYLLGVILFTALVAACGREVSNDEMTAPAPALTATTLGMQTVSSAKEYLSTPPFAAADRQNGERLAQVCRACHSFEESGANLIGPNLFGMFGKQAGFVANFNYSPALRDADFVWTPRALDAWLSQPQRFLPGNRMPFAGVPEARNRNDLIAFLIAVTSKTGDD